MNGYPEGFKIRFYADDSEPSRRVERLLEDCHVPYIKITSPVAHVSPPAVQARGYLFEGYVEIATSLLGKNG